MGSHDMNMVWNAIDAALPTSAEATKGDPFHPEVAPVELECRWEHPANSWRGPIIVFWSQGGLMPRSPRPYVDLNTIRDGCLFEGTQGFVVGDFRTRSRVLLPFGEAADLRYYHRRRKEEVIASHGDPMRRWLEACKRPSLDTPADVEVGGNMIEQNLLAYRAGRKIAYDGKAGRVTDLPAANAYLKKNTARAGRCQINCRCQIKGSF